MTMHLATLRESVSADLQLRWRWRLKRFESACHIHGALAPMAPCLPLHPARHILCHPRRASPEWTAAAWPHQLGPDGGPLKPGCNGTWQRPMVFCVAFSAPRHFF